MARSAVAVPRFTVRNMGSCLNFNGTTAYIDLGTYGNFGSSLSSPFSFSCWLKTVQTAQSTIIGVVNTGTNTLFQINLNTKAADGLATNKFIQIQYRNEGGVKSIRVGNTNAMNFNDGKWHHVVITVDPVTPTSTLYLDSISQAVTYGLNSANFDGSANFGFNLTLGARNNRSTIDTFYAGSLDEVKLYNTVLSQAQVNQLYFQGSEPILANLTNYYKFDENTGTSATDTAGAKTGTLSGSPLPTWTTDVFIKNRTVAGARTIAGPRNPA